MIFTAHFSQHSALIWLPLAAALVAMWLGDAFAPSILELGYGCVYTDPPSYSSLCLKLDLPSRPICCASFSQ